MSDCCQTCGSDTSIERCGCCAGTTKSVPRSLVQRPGLSALDYRVGTHSMFLETMLASLGTTSVCLDEADISSWLLQPGDIVDTGRLISRLDTAPDAAVEDIWARFSDEEKAHLSDPDVDPLPVLIERLTSIQRGSSIYSVETFGHIALTDRTLELATQDASTPSQGEQLNRLLLEAALRHHIRPKQRPRPLERLTTRDTSDFSIALLDGWAMVSDVVSFYQERIANEGFLRTATERQSILELARLTGYELRAGVSASVFLAFSLQDGHEVEIPVGTRAQSTPDPDELPQPFETSDPLPAKSEWNLLQPRTSRPQIINSGNAASIDRLYFEGTTTALKKNDRVLITFGPVDPVLRRVAAVEADEASDRTLVRLVSPLPAAVEISAAALSAVLDTHQDLAFFSVSTGPTTDEVFELLEPLEGALAEGEPNGLIELTATTCAELEGVLAGVAPSSTRIRPWLTSLIAGLRSVLAATSPAQVISAPTATAVATSAGTGLTALDAFRSLDLGESLSRPRTLQPANPARLPRSIANTFALSADTLPHLLTALQPAYRRGLYDALAGAATPAPAVEIYAFRVGSLLYGHNAPLLPFTFDTADGSVSSTGDPTPSERSDVVDLAQPFDQILPGSWVSVFTPGNGDNRDDRRMFALAGEPVESISRADYGISSKVTRLHLVDPQTPMKAASWFDLTDPSDVPSFTEIRETEVLAQAELLTLAEEPILDPAGGDGLVPVDGPSIELARLYEGLEAGRWLIVDGERADIEGVDGVEGTELVMVAGVQQFADPGRPGEQLHTVLSLAGTGSSGSSGLSYQYRRESIRVYGNVVKATHGETIVQALGSGKGSEALQTFALARTPLTHVAAPTAAGAAAELAVRVNGVLWDKSRSLIELDPTDRRYITRTDDCNVTSVIFGDGHHGSRLPSGPENVVATYRAGIGLAGNVAPKKIDLLVERPLGVKEVINPLEASGGADREDRDQARSNAPLAIMALDRLVSVQDYADFARTFAGIAKADAQLMSIGRRQVLHLSVALAADGPFDRNGDLYLNLRKALSELGDPRLPIQIDPRELRLVVASARVRINPAFLWELVEPEIRSKLHEELGFERRVLGRGIASSELLGAIHQVRGVEYVDLDVFDWVDEQRVLAPTTEDANSKIIDLASSLGLNAAIQAQPTHIETGGRLVPAQLAYLSPDVRATLILEELV